MITVFESRLMYQHLRGDFASDIFKYIFLIANVCITIKILQKFSWVDES